MSLFAADKMAAWTGGRWTRVPRGGLVGFTQDTRQLSAGQIFVALKTDRRDGHDFLEEAKIREASAALVGHEMAASDLPQLVVDDPLLAFQRIAREHRREFHGTVIGVTGSVGKTSTKDLLALLLGGSHSVLATEGNLNNQLGVPLTLTKLDRRMQSAAVIEAGIGGPGEMMPLAEMIEPDHAIVTLVAPAHLEKLGTIQGVAAEKAVLVNAVRRGGWRVFPSSCLNFEPFRTMENSLVVVPVNEGMTKVFGRRVDFNIFHRPERTEVTLDGKRRFILRRLSSGMAQNAVLALALASELGVADAVLQSRLEKWQPSKWRGELRQVGDATVYCDFYNANPASMNDAIDAFHRSVSPDLPRIYVLGCMEELGGSAAEYHQQLGRAMHLRRGDFIFVTGSHAAALREGLLENGNDSTQIAIITELTPVRERLAGFNGAVFLKGSRRYQLETVLDATPTHAH